MDLPDRVQQAKEALEIYGRLSNTVEQAQCLIELAWLLHGDEQLDPAAEATSRAIDLIPEKDNRFPIRQSCRNQSKCETEEVVHHLEVALGTLPPSTGTMSCFGFIVSPGGGAVHPQRWV